MDYRDHSTQPSLSVVWSLPSVLWSLAMSACPSMLSTMAGSMGDGWGRQGHSPCIHSWLLLVWILAPGRRERRGTARHCSHRALFGSLFSPICSGAGQRVPKHPPLSTQRTQSQQAHTHDPPVLVSLILFLRPVSGTLPPLFLSGRPPLTHRRPLFSSTRPPLLLRACSLSRTSTYRQRQRENHRKGVAAPSPPRHPWLAAGSAAVSGHPS